MEKEQIIEIIKNLDVNEIDEFKITYKNKNDMYKTLELE